MKRSSISRFVVVLIACVFIGMLPGFAGRGAEMAAQDVKDSQFEQLTARTDDLENE